MKRILLPLLCASAQLVLAGETLPTPKPVAEGDGQTQVSWALFEGPDGKIWSATTESQMIDMGGATWHDWMYHIVNVRVQDSQHQDRGQFTVDLTGLKVNAANVFGPITNHLFNNDDEFELAIDIHMPGSQENGYKGQNRTLVYSLGGEKLMEVIGMSQIVAHGDQSAFIVSHNEGESILEEQVVLDIYQNLGNGIEKAHTFEIPNINTEYMASAVMTPALMSDGIHFIVSHYEQSLALRDENGAIIYNNFTYMPQWTPNNNFLIRNYNSSFQLVDEVKVPSECPAGVSTRTMGIGSFSDMDITQGYFTQDDKYNYIVHCEDMDRNWNDTHVIEVYASGDTHVGTLCSDAGSFWNKLSDVEGYPDQWVFLQSDDYEQSLRVVETPSMQTFCDIPSELDGRLTSANMDRRPDAAEGFKYVIGLNEADLDADDNLLVIYGIYHKDLTLDHYVTFPVGATTQAFMPLVNNMSLDAHLMDADDEYEYIFMTKEQAANGMLYTALYVCKESGQQLLKVDGATDPRGEVSNASIVNYGTDQPELFVAFYDAETEQNTFAFYPLPLNGTGLDEVSSSAAPTGRAYNLMGQPADAHYRGLMLLDGRKIMLK